MILIGVKLCLPVRRDCARVSFLSIYLHISKICCTFAAVFCMNHNHLTRSQRLRAGVCFTRKVSNKIKRLYIYIYNIKAGTEPAFSTEFSF